RWFPTLPTSSFSQIHVRGSFGRYTAGIRRTYIDKQMYPGAARWQQLKEAVTAAGNIVFSTGVDIFAVYQRIGFWGSFHHAERTIFTAVRWKFQRGHMLFTSQCIDNRQAGGKVERRFQYEGDLQIAAGALELKAGRRLLWDMNRWQTEADVDISAKVGSTECRFSIEWGRSESRPELSAGIQITFSETVQMNVSRKHRKSVALLKLQSL
ncbi:MAG: hypothetical protein ACQEQU_07970, partial [Spirochaetota bacterium]